MRSVTAVTPGVNALSLRGGTFPRPDPCAGPVRARTGDGGSHHGAAALARRRLVDAELRDLAELRRRALAPR